MPIEQLIDLAIKEWPLFVFIVGATAGYFKLLMSVQRIVNTIEDNNTILHKVDEEVKEHAMKLVLNDATHASIIEALKDHVRSNSQHDNDVRADLAIIKDRLNK